MEKQILNGPMDLMGDIIAYEGGEMAEDQEVEFFQRLIDTGLWKTLQGSYGRTAVALVRSGLCHWPSREKDDNPRELRF